MALMLRAASKTQRESVCGTWSENMARPLCDEAEKLKQVI